MNIFFLTYIVWILSEVLLNRFVRSGKSDKQSSDKNSELYLWITITIAVTLGVILSTSYAFPIFLKEKFKFIGLIIIIVGIIIRFTAIRQLGRFFTVDVTIRKDHQLMQNGFYKYIRHPSYTGSLLSFLGFGLALNNWISIVVVFIPVLLTFIHRMNIEEKVLTGQFDKQYIDYINRTKRLIPYIY